MIHGGARVEDDHLPVLAACGGGVEAGDDLALLVWARIAGRAHDHAAGHPRIEVDRHAVEVAGAGRPEHLHEISPQSRQERLAFGIAEPAVELEHLGAGGGEHDARVEDPSILDAIAAERVDGGHEHLSLDGGQRRRVEHRGGAVGAHPPRVGTSVAFADSLVVLAGIEQPDGAPIDQAEHAHLLAGQLLLDQDRRPRLAELAVDHHPLDRVQRVGGLLADEDPLAGRQPGGLDHAGILVGRHVGAGGIGVVEDPCLGGGDGHLPHDLLGEGLVRLELGGRLRRAEDPPLFGLQRIAEPRRQRALGSHHHEVDAIDLAPPAHREDVAHVHRLRARLAERGQAAVAGVGQPERAEAGGLLELPGERVLPAAAAHQQHVAPIRTRTRSAHGGSVPLRARLPAGVEKNRGWS